MISVQILAIAYAVIGALLLYLLVATRRSVTFKLFMVVLVSGLYVGTYLGLKELQGWPVEEALPKHFRLHWATINEPDKAQKAKGAIYLWIQPSVPGGKLLATPRAYHLPYELETAEKVQDALRQIDEGKIVEGQLARERLEAETTQDRSSDMPLALDPANAAFQERDAGLEFTTLQRNNLPPKGN
ncbi:MAG: hypothetical protein NWR61_04330 [Pseudomonadales bacterium]|nr:hypothetical protein [Pseudomonadales bacterium]MDP4639541.1 hypothetical protein [Pseudomonadales bacterium]MDP4765559.1 hypothetical protein [Pseudomonadales bacterium]MDP4875206.1 hypothetical protein [Pseudomonadales bacterium]MDP4910977.1 hypothetical protein [Pseudomonadales bacterium]